MELRHDFRIGLYHVGAYPIEDIFTDRRRMQVQNEIDPDAPWFVYKYSFIFNIFELCKCKNAI